MAELVVGCLRVLSQPADAMPGGLLGRVAIHSALLTLQLKAPVRCTASQPPSSVNLTRFILWSPFIWSIALPPGTVPFRAAFTESFCAAEHVCNRGSPPREGGAIKMIIS